MKPFARKAALTGAAFLLVLATSGCAGPEVFGGSRGAVTQWAEVRGFAAMTLRAGAFDLLALRRGQAGETLTIYIEGDGAAWASPYHPPADPTPLRPLALSLAVADPSAAVAYLGRPCQYLDAATRGQCSPDYWTRRRFAPEVIDAYQAALDELKGAGQHRRLRLVGFSGGGVMAALLATRRQDVSQLLTVAAPLAVGTWTRGHGVSGLVGLDPAAADQPALRMPAVHFAGERDKVVPPAVVEAYAAAKGGRVVRVAEADHDCCWARLWPQLMATLPENSR